MIHDFSPQLISALASSTRVAALTGAGISAESGVPTFRQPQTGLWAQYDPQELATPSAFSRDPQLVWSWYEWRRGIISQSKPNPGHFALVEFARRIPEFSLVTQNVDGLHQQAGSPGVIELHGNIFRNICFDARHPIDSWPATQDKPPLCPLCGSLLRPDVVWFGEAMPGEALEAAWSAAESCNIFLSIGTSTIVEPAASLPFMASECGAIVVEINPQPTPLSRIASYSLRGPAGEILPGLVEAVWG
jgi:NAD-dependent deacetylase